MRRCCWRRSASAQQRVEGVRPTEAGRLETGQLGTGRSDPVPAQDGYQDIKISPTGVLRRDGARSRTILAVLRRSDKAVTAKLQIGENAIVDHSVGERERVMAASPRRSAHRCPSPPAN